MTIIIFNINNSKHKSNFNIWFFTERNISILILPIKNKNKEILSLCEIKINNPLKTMF